MPTATFHQHCLRHGELRTAGQGLPCWGAIMHRHCTLTYLMRSISFCASNSCNSVDLACCCSFKFSSSSRCTSFRREESSALDGACLDRRDLTSASARSLALLSATFLATSSSWRRSGADQARRQNSENCLLHTEGRVPFVALTTLPGLQMREALHFWPAAVLVYAGHRS